MQRRKHWTFLCVVLVVVAMFPTSSEAQEGEYSARQCSGPNDIQDVAQAMREQADNGESIFDSLSPSCKDAFVAGNAIASVEMIEPQILDSESQTMTAPNGSTLATTCQTAYVGANHYTLLGYLAFTFNLYEHYCTLADGWRIDGTPYAYWMRTGISPRLIRTSKTRGRIQVRTIGCIIQRSSIRHTPRRLRTAFSSIAALEPTILGAT